jgi:hypothetical protein
MLGSDKPSRLRDRSPSSAVLLTPVFWPCRIRHPMSYYEAEEDDLLFATNYGVGWYSGIQFPSYNVSELECRDWP